MSRIVGSVFPLVLGIYMPLCAPTIAPTVPATPVASTALWEEPLDLPERDLFYGPWGAEYAPDPHDVYTFVRLKEGGTTPGVIVRDAVGREWSVKQGASTLLDRLSPEQWVEAFRAGGYEAAVAARFIAKLRATVDEGLAVGAASGSFAAERR